MEEWIVVREERAAQFPLYLEEAESFISCLLSVMCHLKITDSSKYIWCFWLWSYEGGRDVILLPFPGWLMFLLQMSHHKLLHEYTDDICSGAFACKRASVSVITGKKCQAQSLAEIPAQILARTSAVRWGSTPIIHWRTRSLGIFSSALQNIYLKQRWPFFIVL